MAGVLAGIKVLEVAIYGFVPSAGAVLADWGADVVKVEHPRTGDPIRALPAFGIPPGTGGLTLQWEAFNRGKLGIAIDLRTPEGRELVMGLAETADVFLTNFLPAARRKLGIDVEDVRARNPRIVYARGSGQGPLGPEAETGGFDVLSFWYRGAIADATSTPGSPPPPLPAPAFGDVISGVTLAGGVAAALLARERGVTPPPLVDVSLLGTAMWGMQIGVIGSEQVDHEVLRGPSRQIPGNPLVRQYRTADGRFVALCMLEPDRYWSGLCAVLDAPDLETDARFVDTEARRRNEDECVAVLGERFAARSLAHWRLQLSRQDGQWGVVQTELELVSDPQVAANGYLRTLDYGDGRHQRVVPAPVQFDETSPELHPAPDTGQHTTELLTGLGLTPDQIAALQAAGVVR